MKIKVINMAHNQSINGLEFDAAVSPNKKHAVIYDDQNLSWFLVESDFEIIEGNLKGEVGNSANLIQSIGEKPKRIEIEF